MELAATPRRACLEAPWPLPESPSSSAVAFADSDGDSKQGRVITALGAAQARERRIVCGIDGGQLRRDRGEALYEGRVARDVADHIRKH